MPPTIASFAASFGATIGQNGLAQAKVFAEVVEITPDITRVILRYGFQESPNIPRELEGLRADGVAFEPMQASYFLGRETLVAAVVPTAIARRPSARARA